MSNYTTELRFICEEYAGVHSSKGYKSVNDIIAKSAPKVFDFDFPVFDENYRLPLETKIIRHFYTREICAETVGRWKLFLQDKMCTIMPYYNQLYNSELIKFNPLYDVDYVFGHQGNANENKTQSTEDTKNSTINTEENTTDNNNSTTDFTQNDNTSSATTETDKTVEETITSKTTNYNDEIIESGKIGVAETYTELSEKTGNNKSTIEAKTTEDNNSTSTTESTTESTGEETGEETKNTTNESTTTTEKNINTVQDTEQSGKMNSADTKSYKSTTTKDSKDKYSDTPQGSITDLENDRYLTNARIINEVDDVTGSENGNSNGTSETTGKTSTTETQGGTDNTNATGNETINTTNNKTENTTTNSETTETEKKSKTDNSTTTDIINEQTNTNGSKDTNTDTTNNKNETSNTSEQSNTNSTTDFNKKVDETTDFTSDRNTKNIFTGATNVKGSTATNEKSNGALNHIITNTDEYINHIVGKMGSSSYSKMLIEFRETFLNIDQMIINELNDLFFMLY